MNVDAAFFLERQGYNLLGLDTTNSRARANGDYVDVPRDVFRSSRIPNDDTTINNTRLTDFDGTDLWQLSRGTGEACRQVEELLQFMPKYIPGYEQCALSFIAPVLGVRETRRFLGRRCLQEKDVRAGAIPRDTIALCGYNVDIHHGRDEGSELYIVERGYGTPTAVWCPDKWTGCCSQGG
ncbi:MAG: FAD-dependent oxidoreductase [Ruthenibacterium lactatiformans]